MGQRIAWVGSLVLSLFLVFVGAALIGNRDESQPARAPSTPSAASARPSATKPRAVPPPRPSKWAQPMKKPGLPNLFRVNADLYRGAQPTAEGMKQLKKMGIRTVVNLRLLHSDSDEIGDTDLAYEHLYVNTLHPEDKEVVRFLQIVTDKKRQPVFVHCKHGSDRTGTMCALYRVAVDGWTKEEAIEEMTGGGFGYHRMFRHLKSYIRKLDMDEIKRRVGSGAAGK